MDSEEEAVWNTSLCLNGHGLSGMVLFGMVLSGGAPHLDSRGSEQIFNCTISSDLTYIFVISVP